MLSIALIEDWNFDHTASVGSRDQDPAAALAIAVDLASCNFSFVVIGNVIAKWHSFVAC